MIRKVLTLAALGAALAVTACAPTTRFEWGAYEQTLYAYTQNPENRSVYKTSLEQTIERGQKRNAVAPGMHAELGYLYLEEGDSAAALQHFQQERSLFPESARFMDRVISQIEPSKAVAGGQN